MKIRNLILTLAVLVAAGSFSNARAQHPRGPIHITSVAHAVSHPPDSSGAETSKKIFGAARVIPLHRPEHTGLAIHGAGGEAGPAAPSVGNWADADVQATYNPSQLTVSNVFGGINFTGLIPPDENLSVGINTTSGSPQTQVVQVVNTAYAIFTTSGQSVKSGYLSSSFFGGLTNSLCSTVDGGDPIVLFDKLDGRWLISQLAYDSTYTDDHLCLAISQTSDAKGAYDAYDIPFQSNLPDYPKLAIWPDGVYFSANIYVSNGSVLQFQGAQACSFPRSNVTSPPPSGQITFTCSPGNDAGIYNILPADLENLPGTVSLPSGQDYYMQYVDNVGPSSGNILRIYQFDANAGSLNIVNDLTVNDFHDACGGGTCIPQEGTSQQLDSLGDRLMYRLSFRSYGDHDQMVANHSVQINSSDNQTGVRWYVIRRDQGGAFYVNKESTYGPDVSTYRWMGSIAQNKNGDLGLGYSVSGVTTYPGIAATGLKNGSDTLMEQEQRMYHGTDQRYQGTYSRWGDYSSISVDPTDDCSFWYTNEYVKPPVLSFDFLWNTVIGKLSFGDCSGSSFIITTGTLPGATVNTAYSATLTATGGTTPYTWSISAGSLPAGLTLNASTGAITGTPTTPGTSNFTAKVTDANSQTATQNFSITVNSAFSITTTSLPNGTVGTAYSSTLAVTGGTGPYTWSISAGSLPTGLSLNSGTGAITGTPTAAGTSNFTAKVTDSNSQTATQNLSITTNAALSITTTSLPNGTVNTAYSSTLAATGGTGSYTWSISAGSLPAGLSLNSGTGAITGTPTTAGASNFTVKVTDSNSQTATQNLSITVNSALSITTTSLPNGTVGTAYNSTLAATGGTGSYTWSISAGSLPAGLSLNSSTGAITGTPTTAGTSNFTAKVTDSNSQTATQNLSITINAALSITTTSLPSGTVNTAYSSTLAATGGTGSYTWSISTGSLPTGLNLNSSTGAITGTPTTAGTTNFTAKVTDSNSQTATQSLSITVNPSPSADFALVDTSTGTITVAIGSSSTDTITVTPSGGFTGNVSLSLSGLPRRASSSFTVNPVSITSNNSGNSILTISTSRNTTAGTYGLALTATSGNLSHTINLTLIVGTTSSPDFSISASPSSQTVSSGSSAPYTVTISGSGGFSDGVTLSASGLPNGATATFSPNPIIGGSGSSTMTISTTSGTTPNGTYPLTITGTSTSLTHSTTVTLVVGTAPGGDFSLSASPGSVTLHGGGTAVYTISVTPVSGANPTVGFQVTGLPNGANYGFNPLSVTGSGSTTLSVTVPSGVIGNSTLTITGTNGQGTSHSVSVSLKLH